MLNGLNGVCSAGIIQHDITCKNLVDTAMCEKPRFCATLVAYKKARIVAPDKCGEQSDTDQDTSQYGSDLLLSFGNRQHGIFGDAEVAGDPPVGTAFFDQRHDFGGETV